MPMRPRSGRHFVAAPEKIVIELLSGGRLEGEDLATLRIHAGHHVLDGAVLAGGVHGLKNQEQRPLVLRVETALQFAELSRLCSSKSSACSLDLNFHVSSASKSFSRNFFPSQTR